VVRAPLIQHHYCSWLVTYTMGENVSAVDKIKEKLQKIVRLIVIKARNTLGICRIDEEIHAAGNRTQRDNVVDRVGNGTTNDRFLSIVTQFLPDSRCSGVNSS